jgi:hypothetical protein
MKTGNCIAQTVAFDKAHGIKGTAVEIPPESVDGNDAGMLEPAGDLGFEEKAAAMARVIRMTILKLLKRHFPLKLHIQRDYDLTQAARSVWPKQSETRCRRFRRWRGFGRVW